MPKEEKTTKNNDIEELKTTVAKQAEMIADLMKVADKNRLEWVSQGKEKKGPNRYKLGSYDGKYIVGWRTVEDKVERGENGSFKISQSYEVQFNDDSIKLIVGYSNFSDFRYSNPLVVEEVGRESNNEGDLLIKVKVLDTGDVLSVNAKFLN